MSGIPKIDVNIPGLTPANLESENLGAVKGPAIGTVSSGPVTTPEKPHDQFSPSDPTVPTEPPATDHGIALGDGSLAAAMLKEKFSYANFTMDPSRPMFGTSLAMRYSSLTQMFWSHIGNRLSNMMGAQKDTDRNLGDPALMNADKNKNIAYTDTGKQELFGVKGPQAKDVVQGNAGDCFFLATLAAVAGSDPQAIKDMIKDNKDGTYSVRFYKKEQNGSISEQWITVDDDLARYKGTSKEVYAKANDGDKNGLEEIWVGVAEKAFAIFNEQNKIFGDAAGFQGIGQGGYGDQAYTCITGERAQWQDPATLDNATLWANLSEANNDVCVTAGSKGGTDTQMIADGVVGAHLYTVLGTFVNDAGQQCVVMRNPWGFCEPGSPKGGDGIFAVTLDQFRNLFGEIDMPA